MDEVRNWILAIAGIVTIIKHIYDIWTKESEKHSKKRKALPPGKQEALIHSEQREKSLAHTIISRPQ
ncbi:hypothetical protein KQR57_14885 [Bacillus inaquosorum]|nr:hypothetical protein [Bacillus inaquosorum]